jgi:flavin reductase (DIM6/NTAB) family NADH-FMN oxidoreductase RutF
MKRFTCVLKYLRGKNMFKEIDINSINKNWINSINKEWTLISAKKTTGELNTMTASWGAVGELWMKPVYICFVRPERYTHEFIENSDYYSICFFDTKYKKNLVYLGTKSGRDEDKIAKTKLTVLDDDLAPYFKEAKLVLFCRKIYRDDFKKENFIDKDIIGNIYVEKGAKLHTIYIGEIEKVIEQDE